MFISLNAHSNGPAFKNQLVVTLTRLNTIRWVVLRILYLCKLLLSRRDFTQFKLITRELEWSDSQFSSSDRVRRVLIFYLATHAALGPFFKQDNRPFHTCAVLVSIRYCPGPVISQNCPKKSALRLSNFCHTLKNSALCPYLTIAWSTLLIA